MSTEPYSKHLNLLNAVLSLAYNLESYPSHLFEAGYEISRIEPKVNVRIPKYSDKKEINPDIIFLSKDRALVVECKSGEKKMGHNLKNYSLIDSMGLSEAGIDIPSENLEIDVSIFAYSNLEILKDELKKEGIDYPQVIISDIIEKKYGRDFKDSVLNEKFGVPVKIMGKPLLIVKFTEGVGLRDLAPYVISTLMSWAILNNGEKEFKTAELAEEILGDVWRKFGESKRREMSRKIKEFLRYAKNNELKAYLNNNGEIWKISINTHWKSQERFTKDAKSLIDGFNQKRLPDFGFKF